MAALARAALRCTAKAPVTRDKVKLLDRIFGGAAAREALRPLYAAIVAEARDPRWYRQGGVPDTLDGRFDMLVTMMAMALLRIEADGPAGSGPAALLTELFIDDMDGQLRQIGIGDLVVGKHVGKMMGALGGRIDAWRDAIAPGGALAEAVRRNLHRGAGPDGAAVAWAAGRLRSLHAALAATPTGTLLAAGFERP